MLHVMSAQTSSDSVNGCVGEAHTFSSQKASAVRIKGRFVQPTAARVRHPVALRMPHSVKT